MKVALFVYSLGAGGAERQVSILARELLSRGYEVELFLVQGTVFYHLPENLKITILDDAPLHLHPIKKLLKLLPLAKKYAKLCQADVSLSFMNRPNYINVLSRYFGNRARIVVAERGAPRFHFKGLEATISQKLIRTLYPKADLVVANSLGSARDLQTFFAVKNVTTVPNAFDLEEIARLAAEPIEETITKKMTKFSFITVGRLDVGKNHRLLIEALAQSDIDANLFIIGEGPERENLAKLIRKFELESQVYLLGRKKNPFAYMAKADCFVFGSNNEGFPNVLVEAMACGLPLISTDCPFGPAEILDDQPHSEAVSDLYEGRYGILVPPRNIQAMKAAMKKVYYNAQLKSNYAAAAKKRAENYRKDRIVQKWIETIDKRAT